jgi:pimeloyl-ACP methyl ester carboxylesterase
MALDFALAHVGRVRSLTMIEPSAPWLVSEISEDVRNVERLMRACAGREVTDQDLIAFLRIVGLGGADVDFTSSPAWAVWSAHRNYLSWYGERSIRTSQAGIAAFEHLTVPVLLVRGTRTAPWLSRIVDFFAERLPAATVVELEGGHASIFKSPDEFAAALRDHIANSAALT